MSERLTPPTPASPPLNALRAVEAAIRHGSFLRAADELAVTPAAIAQQVRKLEDWAGVMLFERHPKGVTATALAGEVLADLTAGLNHLGRAAHRLRLEGQLAPVHIAALPAIAQLWLGPRMAALQGALPNTVISVHALDRSPPLTDGRFDAALYPEEPGEAANAVVANNLIPVASPEVAAMLSTPADLREAVLLTDTAWRDDWAHWLEAHDLAGLERRPGPTYSLYSIAVERCLAGDGVLIGHTALVGPHLAAGRLAPPFPGMSLPAPGIALRTAAFSRHGKALVGALQATT